MPQKACDVLQEYLGCLLDKESLANLKKCVTSAANLSKISGEKQLIVVWFPSLPFKRLDIYHFVLLLTIARTIKALYRLNEDIPFLKFKVILLLEDKLYEELFLDEVAPIHDVHSFASKIFKVEGLNKNFIADSFEIVLESDPLFIACRKEANGMWRRMPVKTLYNKVKNIAPYRDYYKMRGDIPFYAIERIIYLYIGVYYYCVNILANYVRCSPHSIFIVVGRDRYEAYRYLYEYSREHMHRNNVPLPLKHNLTFTDEAPSLFMWQDGRLKLNEDFIFLDDPGDLYAKLSQDTGYRALINLVLRDLKFESIDSNSRDVVIKLMKITNRLRESEGLLLETTRDPYKAYQIIRLLGKKSTVRFLDALFRLRKQQRKITIAEVARRAGISQTAAYLALSELIKAGIVRKNTEGGLEVSEDHIRIEIDLEDYVKRLSEQ